MFANVIKTYKSAKNTENFIVLQHYWYGWWIGGDMETSTLLT